MAAHLEMEKKPPDDYIHGTNGTLYTFPRESSELTYYCRGKKLKFGEKNEGELRVILEDLSAATQHVQAQHLTLASIHGEDFMFLAFNADFQSRRVRVSVPAEVAQKWQAKCSKDVPAEHLDMSNTSDIATRDRAIKTCNFARDLTLKDVEKWKVFVKEPSEEAILFESKALAVHEVSDEEEEEEEPPAPKKTPKQKSAGAINLDESDEEGSDRTSYLMPDGSTRVMAVRAGRHVYRLHEENIASKVGKPIECTLEEFEQMRGKGKTTTDDKIHFRHPTLLSGYGVDNEKATMPYVHYFITDEAGRYNDPKYCILYNMNKLHLDGDGQIKKMRNQAEADGRNPDDYPVLKWKIGDIGKGTQLAVTKSGMKTVNDKILPGPIKKGEVSTTVLCKRSPDDEGYDLVQKKVRLPVLARGASTTFVVPAGHSIKKQKDGVRGQVYFTLYNNAESSDDEED